MTLNSERVHQLLAVSGEELTNIVSRWAVHRPGQFKEYWGTCADPITLPDSPRTLTVPRYWETNSRVLAKKRGLEYLLEMAVVEEGHLDKTHLISYGGGPGWRVIVVVCSSHVGSLCTRVCYEKGRQVGGCLSTTPSPTGTYTNIKLATVLDVGRGRLAFIDINKETVLHKFDVTFRQPVYPMFSLWPSPSYCNITMKLYSGREISFTDVKRKLIAKALSSD